MARVILTALLGFLAGIGLGVSLKKYLDKRKRIEELSLKKKLKKEALKVRIAEASTDELLDEISTREDLTVSKTSWPLKDDI